MKSLLIGLYHTNDANLIIHGHFSFHLISNLTLLTIFITLTLMMSIDVVVIVIHFNVAMNNL